MKNKVSVGRHIAALLALLSGLLCAASVPTPRLVPVDPLLSEVDAQSGQMTFYYVGALAGGVAASAHAVVATVDGGSAVRAKLGEDRRATVMFGALAAGTHDIEVALSAPDGATLCRHRYGITARTKRAKAVGRRLNNFVTEILDAPLTDGEVAFENPREGWVFIGFDRPYAAAKAYLDGGTDAVVVFRPDEPSETMRWLKEGRHSLRIEGAANGGRLAIRLVKPLKITARSFAKETTDVRCPPQGYGFDFFRKWIFASFNTLTMGGNWRLKSAEDRMAWGNAELFARGKWAMAASDIRPGNLEVRASLEKMRGFVTGSAAYRDGLPLEVDEHKVNAPAEEMDAFAEAVWEMVSDGKGMAMFADFCDMPGQPLTNLQAQVSALSAVMNTGNGYGMLVPEMYLGTKRTEDDADAEEGRVLAYVESIRKAIPSGPSHIIHLLGGWLTLGGWSNDSSPEADVKVRYDRYLHRLATDPAFADVGGVGMSTLACDEEVARWVARIVHHYCIEGRTDSLAERLGYRYRPETVADGDFMEGLAHWEAAPAAGGAIGTERRIGYGGKKGQCRMARSDTEIGEHFALFTRSASAPNRLAQTLRNVVPGKIYMLTFCTADYDDVIAPGTRQAEDAFCVEIAGGEMLPELSWNTVVPDEKTIRKARKANQPVHCVTVTHRVVFRATDRAPKLTFMDWKSPSEIGGAAGGRQLLNFVRVAPYFPMADGCAALPTRGICGHQGDPQNFPGNTLESLMSAVEKGVAMVEFDLQRCKSGELVLFHDDTLACLFAEGGGRGTGKIRDYTLAELKSRFWVGQAKKCRLATFDEVLAALPRSNLWINVHCYVGKGYVAEIARRIEADGRKHQAFVCGSLGQIREARKAVPDIMACNMSRPGPRNRDWTEAENLTYALDTVTNGCQFLQLCRRWPAKFSKIVHDGGAKVNFFRSDNPDEIEGLFGEGVDFILSNRPGEMVPALNNAAHEVAYIAHQGEEALAPSHSKAAYRLAVEHGLDYMKLDVRETKDGHVVLQHDSDLWATMRWREKIANLTLAEIREKGRCRTRTPYTNETITTLPEALEISKGMRKGVWIDFKHFTPAFAQKVFEQLDAAGYTDDRIMVATFTKPALAWVKEHRPNVRRVAHTAISLKEDGFHVNDGQPDRAYATERDLAEALDAHGKALGLYGFNLPAPTFRGRKGYDTSPALIADLKRRGYWTSIWFVFNPEAGAFYRKAGADAFVTNCKANTFPSAPQPEASARKEAPPAFAGKTVTVSKDFGFDPEDSTRFLQAALSSGAAKVIIDRQATDWVSTSLTGAPNQTVVFEPGVTLRAKPGAFHGRADCLLVYVNVSNVVITGYGATLKMERAIYDKPPYTKSEHRHTLNLRGVSNFRVEGLTCTESGGDGIFIGGGQRKDHVFYPPTNVTLKDVKCVRNYRQGLSVIAVRGLLCDNCDFSETGGTPPESGIDFEPNWPDEVLQDIVVRNCRFENNKGRGYEFYLGNLNAKSAPVTARFENCVTRGNVNGFEYQQRRLKYNDLPVGGRVELEGCTFERSRYAGVAIHDKPETSAAIVFRNCRLVDCCTVSTNGPDVTLQTRLWDTPIVKGVDFSGLEIRQPFPRPKFSVQGTDWTAPGVTVPRRKAFDLSAATVVDPAPGEMRKLEGACPAGHFTLAVYAERPRKVTLRAQLLRLSKRPLVPAGVKVLRNGVPLKRVRLPAVTEEPVTLSFAAPSAGFYELDISSGRHAVRFLEADVPVAVRILTQPQFFASTKGGAYFWTDVHQPFALFAGADSYEKGAVKLFSPEGAERWARNPLTSLERYQPSAAEVKEGLWRIEVSRPKGMHRTIQLDVPGTSGNVFLSPDRYWRCDK